MSTPLDISNAQITAGATQVLKDPYHFDEDGLPTVLIFRNNDQAARNWRRRSRYPPWKVPEEDDTIQPVMAEQETYIARMMQAMYNQDNVLDNLSFRGRKLFTRGANGAYPPPDVEAACRCLFDKTLDECNNGYRGAEAHPVYVVKDKKLNCEQRMNKVIQALNDWKCICKEVYLDDNKIEALADGPIGVYDSKRNNKSSNLQKKSTTAKVHEALKAVEELKTKSDNIPDGDVTPAATPVQASTSNQDDAHDIPAQGIFAATPVEPQRRRTQRRAPTKTTTRTCRTSVPAARDLAPATTRQNPAPATMHHAPAQIAAQYNPSPIEAQPVQAPGLFQRPPALASGTIVYAHLDAPNATQQAEHNFVRTDASYAGTEFQAQPSLLDREPVEHIQTDMYRAYAPGPAFRDNTVTEYSQLSGMEGEGYDALDPSLLDNTAAVYQPQPDMERSGFYLSETYQEYEQASFLEDHNDDPNDPGLPGPLPSLRINPNEISDDETNPVSVDWLQNIQGNEDQWSPLPGTDVDLFPVAILPALPSAKGKRKVRNEEAEDVNEPPRSRGPKRRRIRGRRHDGTG
ncbi:hypothetical protein L13192_11147 [Pyrenophora tritici-repentis]|nr:hypothetical protein L13192_11147 [Pyrenophora tritici-repentis]